MLILGVILLIAGYVLGIGILSTVGWLLFAVGLVLLLIGFAGHPVGGRFWY